MADGATMKIPYKRTSMRAGALACGGGALYVAAMSGGDLLVLLGAGVFGFLCIGLLLRSSGDLTAIGSDADGVTVTRMIRPTRLAWSQVESIEANGDWLTLRRARSVLPPIRIKKSALDLGGLSLAEAARRLLEPRGQDGMASSLASALAAAGARRVDTDAPAEAARPAPAEAARPAPASATPAQALEAALRARTGPRAQPPAFGRRGR